MKVFITTALAALLTASACSPRVLHFTAEPTEIQQGDSVHLEWETRGTAHMTMHSVILFRPPDSLPAMEFLLTATKWGKTSAAAKVQVTIRPPVSRDDLVLTLAALQGDSLVYRAVKDSMYAGFRTTTLQSPDGAAVTVTHGSQQCVLAAPGRSTDCFSGSPYIGPWEAHIKMTPQQQQDPHSRPNTLTLLSTITRKN